MELHLELTQDHLLTIEALVVTVWGRNTSSTTVEIPEPGVYYNQQPVYVVKGPSFPEGQRFAMGHDPKRPDRMLHLAPGEAFERRFDLRPYIPWSKPGTYTLSMEMAGPAGNLRTETKTLEIEEPHFQAFEIAAQRPMQPTFPVIVAAWSSTASQSSLYNVVFTELRPDLGEMKFDQVYKVAGPAEPLQEMVATEHERGGMGSPPPRFAGVSGRALSVYEGAERRQSIDLPFAPQVVHPALMPPSGVVSVFVLDESRTHISLVEFPAITPGGPPPGGQVVLHQGLPHPAGAFRAALGAGGTRAVLLLSEQDGGVEFSVGVLSGGALHFRSAMAPQAVLERHVQPSLHVGAGGQELRASAFLLDTEGRPFVADFHSPAAAGDAQASRGEPLPIKGEIQSGAIAYALAPATDNPRRDWALLLSGGEMISSRNPTASFRPYGRVVIPLQLLAMRQVGYYLTVVDGKDFLFRPSR